MPIDSTALAFWRTVEVDTDASLDKETFLQTMTQFCAKAPDWLPEGRPRPKLSSFLPKPTPISAPAAPATPAAAPVASVEVPQTPAFAVGSRVEAKYRGGVGSWYPGVVAAANGGIYEVAYDDGEVEKNVQPKNLRPLAPAGAPAATAAVVAAAAPPTRAEPPPVKPVIALLGTVGAGKSTLLKAMGGDPEPKPRPTTGFSQNKLPFAVGGGPEVLVHWYDLPGGWVSKWEGYLTEAHAAVYVVAADASEEDFAKAVTTFNETFRSRMLHGKPVLVSVLLYQQRQPDSVFRRSTKLMCCPLQVIANKQDTGSARSAEVVAAALGLSGEGPWRVVAGSAHPARNGGAFDGRVEAGLEWLLGHVAAAFGALGARVALDQAEADRAREAEKIARHRRVMTKVARPLFAAFEDNERSLH